MISPLTSACSQLLCTETAALTLMSTDVDRIALTLDKVHEIWASTLETIIAIYLLERQFGWARVAPLILALGE